MATQETTQRYEFNLFADYFQLYIQDEQAEYDEAKIWWSNQAIADLLDTSLGMIGIGTIRNMTVPLTVEIHKNMPDENFEEWDHVVETSLAVPSGHIVVMGCTDYLPEAARIEVDPDIYKVRVYYGALDTLRGNDLEGNDHYKAVFWPDTYSETRVLKRRKPTTPRYPYQETLY